MAKGGKKGRLFVIELVLKIVAFCIIGLEVVSIIVNTQPFPLPVKVIGLIISIMGDIIFAIAVYTMRDSWRAGIPKNEKTELITSGIYSISRNPTFFGFYLLYIGVLIMFFNWGLCVFTMLTIIMFHLQILQEEKHLITVFKSEYTEYKNRVNRYFGRK